MEALVEVMHLVTRHNLNNLEVTLIHFLKPQTLYLDNQQEDSADLDSLHLRQVLEGTPHLDKTILWEGLAHQGALCLVQIQTPNLLDKINLLIHRIRVFKVFMLILLSNIFTLISIISKVKWNNQQNLQDKNKVFNLSSLTI